MPATCMKQAKFLKFEKQAFEIRTLITFHTRTTSEVYQHTSTLRHTELTSRLTITGTHIDYCQCFRGKVLHVHISVLYQLFKAWNELSLHIDI